MEKRNINYVLEELENYVPKTPASTTVVNGVTILSDFTFRGVEGWVIGKCGFYPKCKCKGFRPVKKNSNESFS